MNKLLLVELDAFIRENDLEFPPRSLDEIYAINWKTRLNLKCKKCGNEFNISVKQLLRPHPERTGKVCPGCNGKDLFINRITKLYGKNPYTFLTPFKGYNEPLTVKCNDCNSEWSVNCAKNILSTAGHHPCKKCASIRNFKQDISTFQKKLEELFGSCNYEFPHPETFTGIYSKQKFDVICKFCGHSFSVHPQNLLSPRNGKHYCRQCSKNRKREL